MPEFCTCGARLPEDARFCHKCGKPQRDEPLLIDQEAAQLAPPPLPAERPEPPPISFRNLVAVRVALWAGVLALLFSAIPGPLTVLAPVGGGFFAVYLYRRRTGEKLTVLNGARLGWISGVFLFAILTVLVTMLVLALSQPEITPALVEQMTKKSPEATKMIELLKSPSGIATLLFGSFLSSTLLPAFGGAVGAKLLRGD